MNTKRQKIFHESSATTNPIVTSSFFEQKIWVKFHNLECQMVDQLNRIDFMQCKGVMAVYNPLVYASEVHQNFLRTYLDGEKKVLFLGMNPGIGAINTGVPFGNVSNVRDWLKLAGKVHKPENEISARPVEGFKCKKVEQSGQKFWTVMEEICTTPENFFKNCFIHNICPLAFLGTSGKNITPAELKGEQKHLLLAACQEHIANVIKLLEPVVIISIGCFANDRMKELIKKQLIDSTIDCKMIPHPSPRSLNNHDWPTKAKKWFVDNQIMTYF